MKNHQYIRSLSVKNLAKILISSEEVNEPDEGMDGEWYDWYITYYVSPDGREYYNEDDAIEHTINWLNSDREKKG